MTEQNTPLQWPVTQLKQMTPIASITPTHAKPSCHRGPQSGGTYDWQAKDMPKMGMQRKTPSQRT